MHFMAPSYARLIYLGILTMDDVPDVGTLREDVEALLEEYKENPPFGF